MKTFQLFPFIVLLLTCVSVNAQVTAAPKPDVHVSWCKVSNTMEVQAVHIDTLLSWVSRNSPVTVTDKKSGADIKVHAVGITTGIKMQELQTAKTQGNLLSEEMKNLLSAKPDVCYIDAFFSMNGKDASVGLVFKVIK